MSLLCHGFAERCLGAGDDEVQLSVEIPPQRADALSTGQELRMVVQITLLALCALAPLSDKGFLQTANDLVFRRRWRGARPVDRGILRLGLQCLEGLGPAL